MERVYELELGSARLANARPLQQMSSEGASSRVDRPTSAGGGIVVMILLRLVGAALGRLWYDV